MNRETARLATKSESADPSWEDWLRDTRERAERLLGATPISARDENWKYTRPGAFEPPSGSPAPKPLIHPGSQPGMPAAGGNLVCLPLSAAYPYHADLIRAQFGTIARADARRLTALNSRGFEDGILLYVPKGRTHQTPIEIVFTLSASPGPAYPRVLVYLGEGASCEVIERHLWTVPSEGTLAASNRPPRVVNAVTEIHLAPDAHLTHYLEAEGDPAARSVSLTAVRQEAGSGYTSYQIDGRGSLLRHEQEILLAGRAAQARLATLTLLAPGEHTDRETLLIHAAPVTQSVQDIRSVVGARATSIYGGRVRITQSAPGSEASQNNQHLLLDPTARAMSRPGLEIGTDEVRCTHGAKSGELDRDALFYLQSRGIGPEEARHLIIQGMTQEFLDAVPSAPVRSRWQEVIAARIMVMERT